jgi:hypothetical protein
MPARWQLGLVLLALSLPGPLRAEPGGAQALIARCAAQAGASLTGISALSRACPGIRPALDQLGLTAFLPPRWQKTLTPQGLADLDALVQHYAQPPAARGPRAATLRSIAGRLAPPRPPPTWSQRVQAWIRHWTDSLLHPLIRWLRGLRPSLHRSGPAAATFYGLIALLLAGVAAFLVIELRGAGLLHRRRRAAQRARAAGASLAEPIETEAGEPDWTLLREQPARLLRLLVAALTAAHRLERERHLTCRELETRARFDTEAERAGFARVAQLAERELFGPPGAAALPEEAVREARMLHARLLAAARADGARA